MAACMPVREFVGAARASPTSPWRPSRSSTKPACTAAAYCAPFGTFGTPAFFKAAMSSFARFTLLPRNLMRWAFTWLIALGVFNPASRAFSNLAVSFVYDDRFEHTVPHHLFGATPEAAAEEPWAPNAVPGVSTTSSKLAMMLPTVTRRTFDVVPRLTRSLAL